MENQEKESSAIAHAGLYALPEECIAYVISLTSPADACRLALVSKTIGSVAGSDPVWEKFLPSDYQTILSQSLHPSSLPVFPTNKQLYLYLSDHPLIIDGGNKSFQLEKWSGKKSYMIAARDLKIAWGDTPNYWTWTSLPDARFKEVAELVIVCWLEIYGSVRSSMLSSGTTYAAYLVFKLTTDAVGLEVPASEVSVGFFGDDKEIKYVRLDSDPNQPHKIEYRRYLRPLPAAPRPRKCDIQDPQERKDGWLEVKLGELFNTKEDREVEMSLMEVKGGRHKKGLIVLGIDIRPKCWK